MHTKVHLTYIPNELNSATKRNAFYNLDLHTYWQKNVEKKDINAYYSKTRKIKTNA